MKKILSVDKNNEIIIQKASDNYDTEKKSKEIKQSKTVKNA